MKKMQIPQKDFTLAKILAAAGALTLLCSAAAAVSACLKTRVKVQRPRKNKRSRKGSRGFSMAEVLLAVGIIVILSAVAFVAVNRYRRGLEQLKLDNIAKEIFVAAQNHLTEAESQGYLGKDKYGIAEMKDGKETGVYYFVIGDDPGTYSSPEDTEAKGSLLSLMLPFASVDEVVRLGGSYVVRYQKATATMLDVFYAERDGSFKHTFTPSEYNRLMDSESKEGLYGTERKSARRSCFGNGAVIGWYGNVTVPTLPPDAKQLPVPAIEVFNEDTLHVRITMDPPDESITGVKVQLILNGETSKSARAVTLTVPGTPPTVVGGKWVFEYTLDDITTPGKDFCSQFCSAPMGSYLQNLTPGENISLSVQVSSSIAFVAPTGSAGSVRTNSLFGDDSDPLNGTAKTAEIASIRHLQNLNGSNSRYTPDQYTTGKAVKATQTADLDWNKFLANDRTTNTYEYKPVDPLDRNSQNYTLDYTGEYASKQVHSITGVVVTAAANENAGIFGTLKSGDKITGLELADISVTASDSGSAGTLAGALEGSAVQGVLVRSGDKSVTAASGSAGGLAGMVTDGSSVKACSASVTVSGSGSSGGLIGEMTGGSVTNSYSGGHTENGRYTSVNVNIVGDKAGGLIGSASGVTVTNAYSTCSVSGSSDSGSAGGLIGEMTGGSVKNSYSVGLVEGSGTNGVFLGSVTPGTTVTGCACLDVAAYYAEDYAVYSASGKGKSDGSETPGVSVAVMDADLDTWRAWVPSTGSADPQYYDIPLRALCGGNYEFKTVSDLLGTAADQYAWITRHYGDWPALETLVQNEKTP